MGTALSPEEEKRLLAAADKKARWKVATVIRVALLTGMRSGEITRLTWGQVDLGSRVITVGRAKTPSGTDRQIPMNGDLVQGDVRTCGMVHEEIRGHASGLLSVPVRQAAADRPDAPNDHNQDRLVQHPEGGKAHLPLA